MDYLELVTHLPLLQLPEETCSYLPDRLARMQYWVAQPVTEAMFEPLLARGWRRFGASIFRPNCAACTACRSLRIRVEKFSPSKSQRRALRRNRDVTYVVQPASVTRQHVRLFNAYHADMHQRRGWRRDVTCEEDYYETFLSGECDFAHEMLYYRDDRLIGVGLVDLLTDASSSVYFFHDPQWRPQSPGIFSLLCEIELARQAGRTHHYLGHWVAENQSMEYKSRFRPHELLQSHVANHETPDWQEPTFE